MDPLAELEVDANFAVWGVDATYEPPGGPEVPVRVIIDHAAKDANLGLTDAIVNGVGIFVRRSEVAVQPVEGSLFVVDGQAYSVRTARQDFMRTLWACDVDPVPSS